MEKVIAAIEIEDQKIEHYSSVIINQKFNEHHTFSIRIKYDVLEKIGSFSLGNAQKLIGKSTVIKLLHANTLETAYEFHGIVCEINVEQSDNFSSDLLLKGYSPTILLENGENFNSFYNKKLQQIVDNITGSLSQVNCSINNNPQYKTQISYIAQYRESAFHFLNRLSSQFGEWFYYDGQKLIFGKPSGSTNVEVTYGIDIHNMQMKLQILPLTFKGYSYNSKDDKLITADAPSTVDGLDQYASFVLNESNKIFSEPVSVPVKPRIENKSDLDGFLKRKKKAMAANLEVLTATSDNPALCIGSVADLKVSVLSGTDFKKEDGGKFLVTSISHHVTANGKYYNSFEAIPSGIDVIPVDNVIVPLAEPQIATVKDNSDPDNRGRVRVQMLWQQANNEMTDWLRVMTPDAGGGKGNAKNRGLVVIPEPGDQVLVCFRYNDPDRPFVLGSIFHGKTGGGGGSGNKTKSLTSLSGSVVSLDGDAINIIDAAGNKVALDGAGKININCSSSITLECGSSKITMDSGGKIEITGTEVTISGSTKAEMKSTASFKAEGTAATVKGTTTEVSGDTKVDVKSSAAVEVGSPSTTVKGDGNLKLQGAMVDVEGSAMTNVKGGVVNLN